MIEYWDYWTDGYDAGGIAWQGTQSTLPVESERDLVAELRAVVEEVTRSKLPAPPVRRMGFL